MIAGAIVLAVSMAQAPDLADAYIRSWVPAARGDRKPSEDESRLWAAVDRVRGGDVVGGETMLEALDDEASPAWLRYEAVLSLSRAAHVRHHFEGGGSDIGGDSGLLNGEAVLTIRELRPRLRERDRALSGQQIVQSGDADVVRSAMQDCGSAPALLRSLAVDQQMVTSGALAQAIQVQEAGCQAAIAPLFRQGSSPERETLRALLIVRLIAAEDRTADAVALLDQAAQSLPGDRACGRAWFEVEAAELAIGRFGSPLTLGMEALAESAMRTQLTGGQRPRQLMALAPSEIDWAATRISRATTAAKKCPTPELALRLASSRALLARMRGDDNAARKQLEAALAEAPRPELTRPRALIEVQLGLLSQDFSRLEKALVGLRASGDLGGMYSAAQVAISFAVRRIYGYGEFDRGAKLLRALSLLLDRLGDPGWSNEARQQLLIALSATGQIEASVALERESVTAAKRLLASAVDIEARLGAAGLNPRDAISGGYRTQLAVLLNGLELHLLTLAGTEGDETWLTQLDEVHKDVEAIGPSPLDQLEPQRKAMNDRFRFLAGLIQEIRHRQTCEGRALVMSERRGQLSTIDPQMVFSLDVAGAACDADARARAKAALKDRVALNRLQLALQWHSQMPNQTTEAGVHAAFNAWMMYLDAAAALKEAGALEEMLAATEPLLADQRLAARRDAVEFFRARLELVRHEPAAAAARLRKLMQTQARLTDLDAAARVTRLAWLVTAEVRAQHPFEALVAREILRIEELELQGKRTGVTAAFSSSPEQASLERKAAWGSPLTDAELARLKLVRAAATRVQRPPLRFPSADDVKKVVQGLPKGWAVLVFFGGPEDVFGWKTTDGKSWSVQAIEGTPNDVAKLVLEASSEMSQNLFEGAARPRAELWRRFIAPFDLDPGAPVAIVTSGLLSSLPFEALTSPDGSPLVATHSIFYSDRLWEPDPPKPQGPCDPGALVVGVNGPQLEFAEQEAGSIADAIGAKALLPPAASRAEVLRRLGGARWIHVAADGSLDLKNPFASALALGGAERLEAWELFAGSAKAELITLSACNTRTALSLGASFTTDFADLVHLAGARWVLASLWQVNDASTALLMKRFYVQACQKGFLPDALRDAKLEVAKSAPAMHWAPFVLSSRSLAAAFGNTPDGGKR
jgi:hypothetical protein